MEVDGIQSIQGALISAIPALFAAIVGGVAWNLICRVLRRKAQSDWEHQVGDLTVKGLSGTHGEQLGYTHMRLHLVGRGSPVDRLFFSGLMVALVILVLTMVLCAALIWQI